MTVNLSAFGSVETYYYVRMIIDEYRTDASSSYTAQELRFSNHYRVDTLNGLDYTRLGRLLSLSSASSELRVSDQDINITISAIPTDAIKEIVYSKIKGSRVLISRKFFRTSTGTLIGTSTVFSGFINNYTINEDYDNNTKSSTNTVTFTCTSNINMLQEKVAGRKTNSFSQKTFYGSDVSMDRVAVLKNSSFDFGAPQ